MEEISEDTLSLLKFSNSLGTSVFLENNKIKERYLEQIESVTDESSLKCKADSSAHFKESLEKRSKSTENTESFRELSDFYFSCASLRLEKVRENPEDRNNGCSPPSLPIINTSQQPIDTTICRNDSGSYAFKITKKIFQIFQNAIELRKRCWMRILSNFLARDRRQSEAEKENKILMSMRPANKIISCLKAAKIRVTSAKTFFRIRFQNWDELRNDTKHREIKKRKLTHDKSPNDESYSATYSILFRTILNLCSPAGYSEVTIEAPGTIKGAFGKSAAGENLLTGVRIEIDPKIFTDIVEKSTRILLRTAVESLLGTERKIKLEVDTANIPNERSKSAVTLFPDLSNSCEMFSNSVSKSDKFSSPNI